MGKEWEDWKEGNFSGSDKTYYMHVSNCETMYFSDP